MIRAFKIIGISICLLALIPLSIAFFLYNSSSRFVASSIQTTAYISHIDSSLQDSEMNYEPIYEYSDTAGNIYTKRFFWNNTLATYTLGDSQSVLYSVADPGKVKKNSFIALWIWPLIALVFGLGILLTGLISLIVIPAIIRLEQNRSSTANTAETSMPASPQTSDAANSDEATSTSENDKNWALIAHLSCYIGFVGVPFGNIIGPLIIYFAKKDSSRYILFHCKESLNFNLSITLYGIIALILCFVLIGFVIIPIVILYGLIAPIYASIQAANGKMFQHRLIIRFIQ